MLDVVSQQLFAIVESFPRFKDLALDPLRPNAEACAIPQTTWARQSDKQAASRTERAGAADEPQPPDQDPHKYAAGTVRRGSHGTSWAVDVCWPNGPDRAVRHKWHLVSDHQQPAGEPPSGAR